MKKKRIIARLDIKGPNVVKAIQFECLRVMGKVEELAEDYYLQGADELLYLDLVANLYNRDSLINIVKKASQKIFIPFTVGGGIRTIEDIGTILRAGADKVAINTAATKNPNLIREAARIFGSQCIVISIEAKKKSSNKWEAYVDGGRQSTGLDVIEWAKQAESLGAGEIVVTSVDRDGTESGLDLELIKAVTEAISIPVIGSGGIGNLEDFFRGFIDAKADALAVGSVLHYNQYNLQQIKSYLSSKNIPVRLVNSTENSDLEKFDPYLKYDLDNYNKYTLRQLADEFIDVAERKEQPEKENVILTKEVILTKDLSCHLVSPEHWEIGVIDYGINNVKSVVNSLMRIGKKARRITTPEELLSAQYLILPGVGAFHEGIKALDSRDLIHPLIKKIRAGTPLLGICLGMQLLFTESEEFGSHKGLNLIPGKVVPFKPPPQVNDVHYKIPHMGWNTLRKPFSEELVEKPMNPGGKNVAKTIGKAIGKTVDINTLFNFPLEGNDVYFVHSFYPQTSLQYVLATATYGGQEFPAVIKNNNILATQFHPEKSGEFGLRLLYAFCKKLEVVT